MPVIDKGNFKDAYEGAIVLEPKTNLYLDMPVACVDYASLYPSSIISENLSHDTKVWSQIYDMHANLLRIEPEDGNAQFDNLPGIQYVDIQYDTYEYRKSETQNDFQKLKLALKFAALCKMSQNAERVSCPPFSKNCLLPANLREKQFSQPPTIS